MKAKRQVLRGLTRNLGRVPNRSLVLIFFLLVTVHSGLSIHIPTALAAPHGTTAFRPLQQIHNELNQAPQLRFEHISFEQGLSHTTVTCILQDSQGFMWFGTQDGLNKYDGYTFTVYRHDSENMESLRDDFILSIYEDRDGLLWIGTQDGSLERLDRLNGEFGHYQLAPHVQEIYEDQSGNFWIGTREGLYLFDRNTAQITLIWEGIVTAIAEDQIGALWAGTEEGILARYDHDNGQLDEYPIGNAVIFIYADRSESLWIGTSGGGLHQLDWAETYSTNTAQMVAFQNAPDDLNSISSDNVWSIYEDQTGAFWLGTNAGLDRFDPKQATWQHYHHDPFDPYSINSDGISSVYVDRSGVVWAGTWNAGINRAGTTGRNFTHYRSMPNDPNSLANNTVSAIYEDNEGILWVGTIGGGLDWFDREQGEWQHYQHDSADDSSLSNDTVRSLYEDRSNVLWIGTESGLDQYDSGLDQFTRYAIPTPMAMLEESGGTFWLATKGGVYIFDRDTGEATLLREGYSWKITLFEDSDGIIWVGTSGDGLERFDRTTDEWRVYRNDTNDPTSLSNDFVEAIFEDQYGVLWLATGGGLNRFDPDTETFTHYRVKDGLPNDYLFSVLPDDQGNFWLSTYSGGVSRFDPQNETFRNYSANDGLQSNGFWRGAYHQSSRGEMFFGGVNGLNAFFPEQISGNLTVPPVVITAFSLFNEIVRTDLPPNEQIVLSHQQDFLSFDFAALDFNAPERNQYAYMMEGLDEDWVQAGTRRHADYPNLPPGDYVFRVKGSNNDGVWNEERAVVYITIEPPFWETWWFRGITGLALAGVLFGGYQLRVRNLESRRRTLEEQVAQRTTELREEVDLRIKAEEALRISETEKAVAAERNRLARDLHDSVTQSLYSLTLLAEAGQRMINTKALDQIETNQSRLSEIAQQALQEMRLLVYELRPLALKQTGLIEALRQRLEAVERRAGIEARLVADAGITFPKELEEELYRVAQEALNNSLKHSQASSIDVRIQIKDQTIVLEVQDDGLGFDLESVADKGGLGLVSMRERAEKIGGQLTIRARPGEGTLVETAVPASNRTPSSH